MVQCDELEEVESVEERGEKERYSYQKQEGGEKNKRG